MGVCQVYRRPFIAICQFLVFYVCACMHGNFFILWSKQSSLIVLTSFRCLIHYYSGLCKEADTSIY